MSLVHCTKGKRLIQVFRPIGVRLPRRPAPWYSLAICRLISRPDIASNRGLVDTGAMTLLYYDPRFLDHDTGHHPEQPERLRLLVAQLDKSGLIAECSRPAKWEPASRQRIERVHTPAHIDRVVAMSKGGGGMFDADTVVCPASADVAQLAVGAACDAVDRVLAGES